MSRLRRTLFALLACASFLTHAAATDEITTAWPVNVGPLNPHLYTPNQMFAQSMVYEPLVKYQADGSVIPWLAKSWTHSTDGKTWTFTLRDDVTFSNGEAFDAHAAAENFRVVLDNRQRHAWLELVNQIVDVKALDKNQLQITRSCKSWRCRARSGLSRRRNLKTTKRCAVLKRRLARGRGY